MSELLHKISKVIELTSTEQVNEYLSFGWVILEVFTQEDGVSKNFTYRNPCYIIGWNKDYGLPKEPLKPAVKDYTSEYLKQHPEIKIEPNEELDF